MPTYILKCDNQECGKYEEEILIRKNISEPKPNCSFCEKDSMVQVFKQAANFRLKGSDWTGSRISGKVL